MTTFTPDLVCADCGDTDISVDCVVVQNENGVLQITAICDDGHTCNVCGSTHITERLKNDAAMKEIQSLLDKREWDAETAEQIAEIVRRTGRPVRHPEIEGPDESEGVQCQINDWCAIGNGHEGECQTLYDLRNIGPKYGSQDGA